MEKAFLILALFMGFTLFNVQAQDETRVQETETTVEMEGDEMKVETETEVVPEKQEKQRTKAGKALHETGSAIGRGAKWTGKKIGDGASWTWGKIKHNKLTKEVFDQPGDKDEMEIKVEAEQ